MASGTQFVTARRGFRAIVESRDRSKRLRCLTAAAAAIPGLLVVGQGTAEAAGPCALWAFPADGIVRITQSNGWTVTFTGVGQQVTSRALATSPRAKMMDGTVGWHSSWTNDNNPAVVSFTINWSSGPQGDYTGTPDSNGFAHGTTYDKKNRSSKASWDSTTAFQCVSRSAR
ncbi:hypothetical protein [Nocardia lijiangensis]|uniref:hypothetical protein n=1 Tax=Nocardia lijiangensis TaxID=299618 RepID=UPI000AD63611|nr:hypothetical protein [Nocardia lijiangensis]